jgi:hypothetical protein
MPTERRLLIVAVIVVGGMALAGIFTAVTHGICGGYVSAVWKWGHANGPAVPFSIACTPSLLANRYALELAWGAGALCIASAAVAVLAWAARWILGPERTLPARKAIGWANVGTLALLMLATMAVAACGEGEVQFFSGPPLILGGLSSALASFEGVHARRSDIRA